MIVFGLEQFLWLTFGMGIGVLIVLFVHPPHGDYIEIRRAEDDKP